MALQLGRRGVGCELNPEYVTLARNRIGRAAAPSTFRSAAAGDEPLFAAAESNTP